MPVPIEIAQATLAGASLQQNVYNPLTGSTVRSSDYTALMVFLGITFDAASTVADIRVKLQGFDKVIGQWFDLQTARMTTGLVAAEHIFRGAAGTTVGDELATTNEFGCDQVRLVAQVTGTAAKAGDAVVARIKGTEA